MSLPPDADARQRALDPEHSFICEAPAGSGKTELLTQRFLTLLGRVKKPEEILAITFTRKATGEMRERVLAAIQLADDPEPEQPHRQLTWQLARRVQQLDRQFQWQLLQNPNRLQIKTFDSLCASLARNLPMESTFGAMPRVTEDADELYSKAVRALLATLEEDVTWSGALATVLELLHNRFERFEGLMIGLLAKREQWLPLMAYGADRDSIRAALEATLQRVRDDSVEAVLQLISADIQRNLVELASFAAANLCRENSESVLCHCQNLELEWQTLPGSSREESVLWQGILTMLLTDKDDWRKTVTKTTGFPPGNSKDEKAAFKARKQQLQAIIEQLQQRPDVTAALVNLRYLPDGELSRDQWHILDALFTLLPILTAQLTMIFRETNSIDFTELSLGAHRALGGIDEPSQLAMKLDYRLSHILVDEFQDTSASQVDLLNQLTAGWQPDDGRTLFCVGDAMQSIYGFRGANVGLFLNCREHGLENVPLQPLRLTANFRSQAGIVNWVNKIFKPSFPQQNNASTGAVCYADSDPIHPPRGEQAVWVNGFVDPPDNLAEAQKILDIIQTTRAENPEASIAILVRNRGHVKETVRLLKEAQIRYRAVELEPLFEHSVVQDLMALTRALMHPADRTAWLAVLRAPWCGLILDDLDIIANTRIDGAHFLPAIAVQCQLALSGTGTDRELSIEGKQRLERVLPILIAAQRNRERKTLRSWIEGCWLQLGGPAVVDNVAALENASVFFQLLERWEYASDLPSMDTLNKSLARLYASPDPQADENLQIMTIHKSKGLEFDVVIVPQLHRQPRSSEKSLLMWQERLNTEGETDLIMTPLTAASGNQEPPTYAYLRREEKQKTDYENCRLLYVACTRAKQKLYLSAQVAENPKNITELKKPANSSLLATIWEPVQLSVKRIRTAENDPGVDQSELIFAEKPPALYRLNKRWKFPEVTSENLLEAYIPPYEFAAGANDIQLQQQSLLPRQLGTCIHHYLQLITEQGVEQWSVDKVAMLEAPIELQLRNADGSPKEQENAVKKVIKTLQSVLMDNRGRWILSSDHPFVASEFPVTYARSSSISDLIIDRVITDTSGHTWIIDYKTSEPLSGQSMPDFLNEQHALYAQQLDMYKSALKLAGFANVSTALYFPLSGQWLECDPL